MKKRLYRSRKHKIIGGVAGGLAEYFDIDPIIVRVVFLVLLFGYGSGVLAYLILWVIMPLKKRESNKDKNYSGDKSSFDSSMLD